MAHCRTSGVSALLLECALGLEVIDQSDDVPVAVFAEEFRPDVNLAFLHCLAKVEAHQSCEFVAPAVSLRYCQSVP